MHQLRILQLSSLLLLVEQAKFAQIIVNWIDRKDSNALSFNNKYKFNLIYKKKVRIVLAVQHFIISVMDKDYS